MRISGSAYHLGYNQLSLSSKNGPIGLPVSSKSLIYSQYKHVRGYTARANSKTVPLSKIRILNSIIENLSRIKGDLSIKNSISSTAKMSSEATDRLIETYAKELHRAVASMNSGFQAPETGLVVSLTA